MCVRLAVDLTLFDRLVAKSPQTVTELANASNSERLLVKDKQTRPGDAETAVTWPFVCLGPGMFIGARKRKHDWLRGIDNGGSPHRLLSFMPLVYSLSASPVSILLPPSISHFKMAHTLQFTSTVSRILPYIIPVLLAYPLLISLLRFRRLHQLHEKYSKYSTRESLTQMTDDEAFEIQKQLAQLEFPFIYKKALQFALFRVRFLILPAKQSS